MIRTFVSSIAGASLVLSFAWPANAPRHAPPVLYGTVTTGTDSSSSPVDHAQITIRGTSLGANTGSDGRYTLVLADSLRGRVISLDVRRIGYAAQHLSLEVNRDSLRADFRLAPAPMVLQELVVTGAAAAMVRKSVGASVSTLNAAGAREERQRRSERDRRFNTESYDRIEENTFRSAKSVPLSTFSIDVDRASYANVRRYVTTGQLPPADAVRLEELVNYFPYDYVAPGDERPVHVTADVAIAPWAPEHRLVRIALQAKQIPTERLPASNLVFLIDVSGSMQPANKLPLLKEAFLMLVDQLRENDRVAIVVYAGNAGLVLPSTAGSEKAVIREAIARLEAGGSTAGGAGIRLAYDVAWANFITGGNNRVILATDGDFNVGTSSDAEMERLIEEKRKDGTFLTVLGFGMGNLKDSKLEKLADRGNGNYAYVDSPLEARKVLVHEFGGTLLTVAKDVKLQVEFNPRWVKSYRLLGYENRLVNDEDFTDDAKDAGDMGAGHSVTAFYEVVPIGVPSKDAVSTQPLRYQEDRLVTRASMTNEIMQVKLRYKERDDSRSQELRTVVRNRPVPLAGDFAFASAVAEFALVLRDSKHRGTSSIGQVLTRAEANLGEDNAGYRRDFLTLVRSYEALRQRVAAAGSR